MVGGEAPVAVLRRGAGAEVLDGIVQAGRQLLPEGGPVDLVLDLRLRRAPVCGADRTGAPDGAAGHEDREQAGGDQE
jgi:hypothetical protein